MKDKLLAINGPLKGTYLEVSRGESRLVVQAGNLTHTYDREGLHSLVFVRTDSVVKDNVTDAMAFSTNQALDHRRTWTLIDRRKVPKALSLPFDDERSVIIAGAAGHIPTNGACFCLMTKTLRIYGETITQVVVAWNRVKTTYSQYSDIAIESISRTNFTCQNGDLSDMTAEMVQCVDMSGCTVPENATID